MISRIGSAPALPVAPPTKSEDKTTGSFGESLESAIDSVNKQQVNADDRLVGLASGQETDLHGMSPRDVRQRRLGRRNPSLHPDERPQAGLARAAIEQARDEPALLGHRNQRLERIGEWL